MLLPSLKAHAKKMYFVVQWRGRFPGSKIKCSWLWLEHKLYLLKATEQPRDLGESLPPAALACFAKHTFLLKSSTSVLLTPHLRRAERRLLCCSLWVTQPRFILCGSVSGQALTNHIFKNRKIPADNLNIWSEIFAGISGLWKATCLELVFLQVFSIPPLPHLPVALFL